MKIFIYLSEISRWKIFSLAGRKITPSDYRDSLQLKSAYGTRFPLKEDDHGATTIVVLVVVV